MYLPFFLLLVLLLSQLAAMAKTSPTFSFRNIMALGLDFLCPLETVSYFIAWPQRIILMSAGATGVPSDLAVIDLIFVSGLGRG